MVALTIRLKLPPAAEARLRAQNADLNADVTESYAVELFRRGLLSFAELGQTLGLDRFQTGALLKRRGVFEGSITYEEVEADVQTLWHTLGPVKRG